MSLTDAKRPSRRNLRLIARIEQQIDILENMDAALWWKIVLCTCAIFVVLTGAALTGFLLLGYTLSWSTLGLTVATVLGLIVVFHFWRPLLWLTTIASFMVLLALIVDGIDDAFWPDAPGTDAIPHNNSTSSFDVLNVLDFEGEKSRHRQRIEHAIAKRKAKLRRLLDNMR
jgi:hypothetical protein